jgi:hypothetical protein
MQLFHGPRREHHFPVSPLVCVMSLLPNNGRCLQCHHLAMGLHATWLPPYGYSSVRAYRHTPICACDVCEWSRLPSPWLGSHDDYFPTAPAAPSLRPLVPSSPMIRCELVQVYHHQPPLDSVGKSSKSDRCSYIYES